MPQTVPPGRGLLPSPSLSGGRWFLLPKVLGGNRGTSSLSSPHFCRLQIGSGSLSSSSRMAGGPRTQSGSCICPYFSLSSQAVSSLQEAGSLPKPGKALWTRVPRSSALETKCPSLRWTCSLCWAQPPCFILQSCIGSSDSGDSTQPPSELETLLLAIGPHGHGFLCGCSQFCGWSCAHSATH